MGLGYILCFSSLMDIDKLILQIVAALAIASFSSLMDIDKLILQIGKILNYSVLVL